MINEQIYVVIGGDRKVAYLTEKEAMAAARSLVEEDGRATSVATCRVEKITTLPTKQATGNLPVPTNHLSASDVVLVPIKDGVERDPPYYADAWVEILQLVWDLDRLRFKVHELMPAVRRNKMGHPALTVLQAFIDEGMLVRAKSNGANDPN